MPDSRTIINSVDRRTLAEYLQEVAWVSDTGMSVLLKIFAVICWRHRILYHITTASLLWREHVQYKTGFIIIEAIPDPPSGLNTRWS